MSDAIPPMDESAQARIKLAEARAKSAEVRGSEAATRYQAAQQASERHARDARAASKRIADLESRLAAATAELHARRHDSAQLGELSAKLADILRSRSWRLTRPIRVLARLLRGEWGSDDGDALRHQVRNVLARVPLLGGNLRASLIERTLPDVEQAGSATRLLPDERMAAMIELTPAQDGCADVFIWAVIDWHFRVQRPQHLARALAANGHRVFYISNNFADSADPGFRLEPIARSSRLFQVHLNLAGAPPIYFGLPDAGQVEALRASLSRLLTWTGSVASLSLVQHPYWTPLATMVPNARLVYDCMDHHAGFENNAPTVLTAEARLQADADLVVVTSEWLEKEIAPVARATTTVRNAGEYEFFSRAPEKFFRDEAGRRVIGYFGAIAEWFDVALVRKVAQAHPDALVVLVGSDTTQAAASLADLANVKLVGEVKYADLPFWLHGFHVALLPFKVIELTLATNPVKVYEYLAAGKPVVAVDLPEMAQFEGLVAIASDHAQFVAAVGAALREIAGDERVKHRQTFAAGQTWGHRARAIDAAIARIEDPLVSIIVLAYNNLSFTRTCLESIEALSDYRNLEVIVVDNASVDGSREWLSAWSLEPSRAGHARRVILNDDNLGFAAGNNVGLEAARGELLVMLNNDTHVTFGWVRTMYSHFRRDPLLGLLGPVTNNIGNEAKIAIAYDDFDDMQRKAGEWTRAHVGEELPMRTVAFFCVALPRAVYREVGGLDEAFGVGFFEDDDYCRRVAQAGWSIACAEDVFVHHHLSASFDQLKADARQALFERNKAIYEAKWGEWVPHVYRGDGPRFDP